MQEIDINELINQDNELDENIPNNIIIVGKIKKLYIKHKYNQLDLSELECDKIYYRNQKGKSIKNHILPNLLKELICGNNDLTSLPDLPNLLETLWCNNDNLTSLPDLPESLVELRCFDNRLTSLPKLPNSLEILDCNDNQLVSLPELPNSLKELYCGNQLTSLPEFKNKIKLYFNQDKFIEYIPHTDNIELNIIFYNRINIIGYPNNPITNQEELNRYMEYQLHKINSIKSARK